MPGDRFDPLHSKKGENISSSISQIFQQKAFLLIGSFE